MIFAKQEIKPKEEFCLGMQKKSKHSGLTKKTAFLALKQHLCASRQQILLQFFYKNRISTFLTKNGQMAFLSIFLRENWMLHPTHRLLVPFGKLTLDFCLSLFGSTQVFRSNASFFCRIFAAMQFNLRSLRELSFLCSFFLWYVFIQNAFSD